MPFALHVAALTVEIVVEVAPVSACDLAIGPGALLGAPHVSRPALKAAGLGARNIAGTHPLLHALCALLPGTGAALALGRKDLDRPRYRQQRQHESADSLVHTAS
jgi:hypothetical protein